MTGLDSVVRKLRRERGWTQGQLSLHSGVSRASIALIETGERETPNIVTVSKLAGAFRVSVDRILIEAGFLPVVEDPAQLSGLERDFIEVIRAIPSENIRRKTLELAIGFATVARDADAAREEPE